MNSCNTDIFFSNYYHLQSVRLELFIEIIHGACWGYWRRLVCSCGQISSSCAVRKVLGNSTKSDQLIKGVLPTLTYFKICEFAFQWLVIDLNSFTAKGFRIDE